MELVRCTVPNSNKSKKLAGMVWSPFVCGFAIKLLLLHLIVVILVHNVNGVAEEPTIELIRRNIAPEEYNLTHAIKVSTVGFRSNQSHSILHKLLNEPTLIASNELQSFYQVPSLPIIAINPFHVDDSVASDISVIYIDRNFLMNPDNAISTAEKVITSLLSDYIPQKTVNGSQSQSKKSLLVILVSNRHDSKIIAEKSIECINNAWSIAGKHHNQSLSIMDSLNIQIVSISSSQLSFNPTAISTVQSILTRYANTTRTMDQLISIHPLPKAPPRTARGKETDVISFSAVLPEIRIKLRSKVQELYDSQNKGFNRKVFYYTITEICKVGAKELKEYSKYLHSRNRALLQSAIKDMERNVYLMSTPLYKQLVQGILVNATNYFNQEAIEELVVSPKLDQDLYALKKMAIKQFKQHINEITPSHASLLWNSEAELFQFEHKLEEYIQNRIDVAKVQGVLPRKRKPMEISYHHFFRHPLGRDYRQDPIGYHEDYDVPIFDKNLTLVEYAGVQAMKARQLLKELLSKEGSKPSKKLLEDSEFAREMAMLPLSIKNPTVKTSRAEKRAERRKHRENKLYKQPYIDLSKYLRWDIKPLDEVKANMDMLNEANDKNPVISNLNKFLNRIPLVRDGIYFPPFLKYGPKWRPKRIATKKM